MNAENRRESQSPRKRAFLLYESEDTAPALPLVPTFVTERHELAIVQQHIAENRFLVQAIVAGAYFAVDKGIVKGCHHFANMPLLSNYTPENLPVVVVPPTITIGQSIHSIG